MIEVIRSFAHLPPIVWWIVVIGWISLGVNFALKKEWKDVLKCFLWCLLSLAIGNF